MLSISQKSNKIKKLGALAVLTVSLGVSTVAVNSNVVSKRADTTALAASTSYFDGNSTHRIHVTGGSLTVLINASKGGSFTYKVFKNGSEYRSYTGSGHVLKTISVSDGYYSVHAYNNTSGQSFSGAISTSHF